MSTYAHKTHTGTDEHADKKSIIYSYTHRGIVYMQILELLDQAKLDCIESLTVLKY